MEKAEKQSSGPWGAHVRARDEDKHHREAEKRALNLSKQHLSLTSDRATAALVNIISDRLLLLSEFCLLRDLLFVSA